MKNMPYLFTGVLLGLTLARLNPEEILLLILVLLTIIVPSSLGLMTLIIWNKRAKNKNK